MKKSCLISVLLTAMLFVLCASNVYAEGSKSFTQYGGFRAYTEWDDNNFTASIERTTKLNVYAKAGETIYLGSSVVKANDGSDIVLMTPDGQRLTFDVISGGIGHINTYAKEQAGPTVGANKDGYTPFEYSVSSTGVYAVEFHSPAGAPKPSASSNPTPVSVNTIPDDSKQSRCVAAWDISVFDAEGAEKTGRVFTSYLALNMGDKEKGFFGRVYVLTKDGYVYNIKMNDIAPYGFIMYANNRGLVDATSQMSLYKNAISPNNEMTVLNGNVIAPRPDLPDTDKSYTHYVFFNEPSADLPESMPTEPQAIAEISDFSFEGVNGSTTTVSSGGYFTVKFNKKTTYQLIIDTNKDGEFTENDVIIADAAAKGVNKIFWNGNDTNGNPVAAGDYNVKLYTKGGEYHFPMLDVESSKGGISIKLMNDSRISEEESYTVYYDNSSYTTANGTTVNTKPNDAGAINPVSALGGISSADGCYKFGELYGDQMALDVWTYTLGNEATTSLTVVEGIYTGTVSGDVFFDADNDSKFGANEAGISGVNVTITAEDGTVIQTTTDSAGKYSAVIPLGAYTVTVTDPEGKLLTTADNSYSGVLTEGSSNAFLSSTGYYNGTADISVTVNNSNINKGNNLDYIVTIKNSTQSELSDISALVTIPTETTYLSDTSSGKFDSESGTITIASLKPGESYSFSIKVKANTPGDYTVIAAIGTDKSSNASYTVTDSESVAVPSYSSPYVLESNYAYIFGYNDTEMAADEDMKIGESCAVLYRLLKQNKLIGGFSFEKNSASVYPELNGRWDRSAAEFMIYKGVFANDMPEFRIDGSITRKEAFKMFAIALGFTNDLTLSFEQYALILQDAGYVEGDGTGDIKINDFITRAEFCKIYNMIIGRDRLGLSDTNGETVTAATYGFEDINTRAWYYEIMLKATSAYDDDGYIDLSKRGIRNSLDDYE